MLCGCTLDFLEGCVRMVSLLRRLARFGLRGSLVANVVLIIDLVFLFLIFLCIFMMYMFFVVINYLYFCYFVNCLLLF